jgi:hypothetical protein
MDYAPSTTFISEIERYLALVDLFRAEGCEPHWQPEPTTRRRRPAVSRTRGIDPLESISRRMK